jgi:hypothetical protein
VEVVEAAGVKGETESCCAVLWRAVWVTYHCTGRAHHQSACLSIYLSVCLCLSVCLAGNTGSSQPARCVVVILATDRQH